MQNTKYFLFIKTIIYLLNCWFIPKYETFLLSKYKTQFLINNKITNKCIFLVKNKILHVFKHKNCFIYL